MCMIGTQVATLEQMEKNIDLAIRNIYISWWRAYAR